MVFPPESKRKLHNDRVEALDMARRSRRALLAALAGGVVTLPGCSAFGDGSDGSEPAEETPTGSPDDAGGGDTPTATDPTPTETPAEQSQLGEVEGTAMWPSRRGPPSNTGSSSSGGSGGDATSAFTAELRDGYVSKPTDTLVSHTPVVGEEAIYTVSSGPPDPYATDPPLFSCFVYAFSREDGSELWRTTVQSYEGGENGEFPKDTSLCLGPDGLYICWVGEETGMPVRVARLSADDGSEQWRSEVSPTGGVAHQPVVRDGRVHLIVNDRVVAFDTESGDRQWETPQRVIDQPIPTVGPDCVAVYHTGTDHPPGLTVFETDDQSVRWHGEYDGPYYTIPSIAGDTVFLTDGNSGRRYLAKALAEPSDRPKRKIRALSLSDGSEQWTHTYDTEEIHNSPTAGGTRFVTVTHEYVYYALGFRSHGEFYLDDEERIERIREQLYRGPNVVALNRSDGSVAWKTTVGSQARVFRPMVAGPDNLYALYRGIEAENEGPAVYVIDRENGEIQGSVPVETGWPITVADGALYTHRDGSIVAWE